MVVKKVHLDWQDIETLTNLICLDMERHCWCPSVVVGLTRGGLLPATMISHRLKVPMCSLDVSLRDAEGPFGHPCTTWIPEEVENGHKILVVDDINDTGATFQWIRDDWQATMVGFTDVWPADMIKFASLVHNDTSPMPTDFRAMSINKDIDPCWICFPWETWSQRF